MAGPVSGTFELGPRGRGGHLRDPKANYRVRPKDVVVPEALCKQFNLRGGETIEGTAGGGGRKKNSQLTLKDVQQIDGLGVEDRLELKPFEDLIAIDPEKQVMFETDGGPLTPNFRSQMEVHILRSRRYAGLDRDA